MSSFQFTKENTFCISLPESTDRWEKMVRRFTHFGMENKVTKWNACSASNTQATNFVHYLNGNQRGCAQSHITIWNHIVTENLPYALILEDDAKFDDSWLQKLADFWIKYRDSEWDAIFLNASEPVFPLHMWCEADDQFLTGGYIISNRGAHEILSLFQHCFYASDWMTRCLQTRGRCYTYYPWLIIQEGTDSIIGSNVEADHEKVVRCLGDIQYDIQNYI
jgi:GR25 family glycosyltransferase involved in LPS biosynthesis